MMDRVLALEGVYNFRDAGGYAVSGGGKIKRGMLWRSGQHHDATEADLQAIAALGLASVFDLRSSMERKSHPCKRPEPFDVKLFLSGDPELRSAPHIAAARSAKERTVASTHESLKRNYGGIAFRPELLAMMRSYVDHMTKGEGPSLINCMAGKDRTGIAVAMLQTSLGVHRDDIMADYLLTNTAGDVEARIAGGLRTIRAITGDISEDVVRVLMSVEPDYLEQAWAATEERYGNVDTYLATELGVDDAKRDALRASLTES